MAIWYAVASFTVRVFVGRLLLRLGLPGAVSDFDASDADGGFRLRVRVGTLTTVVKVNDRSFYFGRLTGRPQGGGWSLCESD